MNGHPTRSHLALVFFGAFACLMFELIISRLADVHLGERNDYLAIPITFMGLALGSLHVHFAPRIIERFDARRSLVLLASVVTLTIGVIYLMFTRYMPVVAADADDSFEPLLLWKMFIFIGVFGVPFYVFGRILTVCYHLNRAHIGAVYSADFFGAALACFLTPVLFHFVSLPEIVTLLLGVVIAVLLAFLQLDRRRALQFGALAVPLLWGFHAGVAHMEHGMSFVYNTGELDKPFVREVVSRWNEFSRVQLVHFEYADPSKDHYKIIHDNARSNVHVSAYRRGRTRQPDSIDAQELPFILGRPTANIMVMFAGCGAEMIMFDKLAAGAADITGVEINPLPKRIASTVPELRGYRLREFYRRPNIHLQIAEGRSFLMSNRKKFDVIYVGSSAGTSLAVTGHTRKFLYTQEAFELYLKALEPTGVLVFDHQPIRSTLETLKGVMHARGQASRFKESTIVISDGRKMDLAFAPNGFHAADVERLAAFDRDHPGSIVYAPFRKGSGGSYGALIRSTNLAPAVVDDRPYLLEIDLAGYKLFPGEKLLRDRLYYLSWIKVTTLVTVSTIALLCIALASLSRSRRLPPSVLSLLLLTGFCYLLVEIAYIAKLELFLQNPLVSMASVITIFLLTSGLGSLTHERLADRLGMRVYPFFVAGLVALSIPELEYVLHHLLALPLVGKLAVVVCIVGPVGWALGMFYPIAVSSLVRHGREQSVAITYGISTLSSVVGATYAMTMMLAIGFNQLLRQAAIGYAILGVAVIVYRAIRGRQSLIA